MYLAYALFCEGSSDFDYLEVLIPRLVDELVRVGGVRPVDAPSTPAFRLGQSGRSVDSVAEEACEKKDAVLLVFIHADTGGSGQAATLESRSDAYCRKMREVCGLPPSRCVLIRPRHETEAWALADPTAVLNALGFTGPPERLGLPATAREAERMADPKGQLRAALRQLRGRRRRDEAALLPAIAQRQSVEALRGARSFVDFERRLTTALEDLGAL